MQQIFIDFNAVTYAPVYAGEIGESRAVRLHLIPPDYMSSDESIVRYNVAFKIAAGVVLSELFNKDDEINIDLGAPLTDDNQLVMQLIGMSSDGETVISKTPLLQLIIGDSIDGEIIPDPATGKTIYTEILELEEKISEIEVKELYDAETGKPAYTVTEIDEMYAAGNLLTWKGRPVIAVDANTQWNRYLYFPRASAGRSVTIKKQSVQNGAVIGVEEDIGGFSDINFTLNHFNRLYGIEAGAQVNCVDDVVDENGDSVVDEHKKARLPKNYLDDETMISLCAESTVDCISLGNDDILAVDPDTALAL